MQPDPSGWFHKENEPESVTKAFSEFIFPLSHVHINSLMDKVEAINTSLSSQPEKACAAYADMPDYWQIVNGYLMIADEIEKSSIFAGRQNFVKLDSFSTLWGCQACRIFTGVRSERSTFLSEWFLERIRRIGLKDLVKKVFASIEEKR